jgi:hypothetical protein
LEVLDWRFGKLGEDPILGGEGQAAQRLAESSECAFELVGPEDLAGSCRAGGRTARARKKFIKRGIGLSGTVRLLMAKAAICEKAQAANIGVARAGRTRGDTYLRAKKW